MGRTRWQTTSWLPFFARNRFFWIRRLVGAFGLKIITRNTLSRPSLRPLSVPTDFFRTCHGKQMVVQSVDRPIDLNFVSDAFKVLRFGRTQNANVDNKIQCNVLLWGKLKKLKDTFLFKKTKQKGNGLSEAGFNCRRHSASDDLWRTPCCSSLIYNFISAQFIAIVTRIEKKKNVFLISKLCWMFGVKPTNTRSTSSKS